MAGGFYRLRISPGDFISKSFSGDLTVDIFLLEWSLSYRHPCLFRLTIRMEMAAGVTPEILEAWPRE